MRNKRPTNSSMKGGTFNEADSKNEESELLNKINEVEEGHWWSELLEARENP